jgi:pimeloyl-ACP methyl ester carboxylesterase
VFAFDMHGFGTRILEAARFYDRYPHWSQLGRMIDDVRAAIDASQLIDRVDPARLYLFGYSIGATVGIYTAALDARVKGLVSICGFTPMRLDTAGKGTEGVARYSHLHGLVPRLGFFAGAEQRIPYDFDELLASIAPRPVLVMAPQLDRDATFADVEAAVERARRIYKLYDAAARLEFYTPWDYNRLPEAHQQRLIEWVKANFN